MQTVPEDSGGVRVDDESWHPNVGDVLDVTVTLSAAVVANNDWGDLALDLPDGRSVIALNGTWTAQLAEPDHWPPAAGQVWRTRLARPSVDGSTHVIWFTHWYAMDASGDADTTLVLRNGFGETITPARLLGNCRELGTGLPELVPVTGGPGTVLVDTACRCPQCIGGRAEAGPVVDIPEPVATVQHTRPEAAEPEPCEACYRRGWHERDCPFSTAAKPDAAEQDGGAR